MYQQPDFVSRVKKQGQKIRFVSQKYSDRATAKYRIIMLWLNLNGTLQGSYHTSKEEKGKFYRVTYSKPEGNVVRFVADGESHGKKHKDRLYTFHFDSVQLASEFHRLIKPVFNRYQYS